MQKSLKWAILVGVTCCSLSLFSAEGDSGYFLSWSQKGELIWSGRIKDQKGDLYDIWICPGYVDPTDEAAESLGKGFDNFGEYFGSRKYEKLVENSGDAFEWAFDDCLWKWTIRGIPKAWGKYFEKANNRAEQKVFGWWLSYPWALMQSVVDTTFRIPTGITGTVFGVTGGTAFVPLYYTINSGTQGTCRFIFPGTLYPLSAYTWNTLVSPPLALVGQKPSESRADGFWVVKLKPNELQQIKTKNKVFQPKELKELKHWGLLLSRQLQPYEDQRRELDKEYSEKVAELNKENQELKKGLTRKENQHFDEILKSPEYQDLVNKIKRLNYSQRQVANNKNRINQYFREQGLTKQQQTKIYLLLRKYHTGYNRSIRAKTNPVNESINVIKNAEK